MKICPVCTKQIHSDALKCKHCGETLDSSTSLPHVAEKLPWYFRKPFIIFALLSVGPIALPLIWWRPDTTRAWKVGLTLAILLLSWAFYLITLESLRTLEEYYKLLEGL